MKRTVKINGMGCQHCVNRITEALSAVESVEVLEVSLENKSATVNAADSVSDEALMNAVNEEGFEAIEVIK